MKNSFAFTDMLEKDSRKLGKKNQHFFNQQLIPTRNRLVNLVLSESKIPIIDISHLADADGFNFLAATELGLSAMSRAVGTNRQIIGQRYMSFSSNPKSENNIENILKKYENIDLIIGDMPTLDPTLINPKKINSATIIDHHPIRFNFPKYMLVCNPWNSGINGSEEFSAAMIAGNLIGMTYESLLNNPSLDKQQIKNLKKIKDIIHRSMILGIAGAQADMQEAEKGNLTTFKYLESQEYRSRHTKKNVKKNLIEKINTPFFGYATKSIPKIIAQTSNPSFHFPHRVVSEKALTGFLHHTLKKSYRKTQRAVSEISKKFDIAFIRESKNKTVQLNIAYLQSIDFSEVEKLNNVFQNHFGINLVEEEEINGTRTYKPQINIEESDFDYEKRYIVKSEERNIHSNAICMELLNIDNDEDLKGSRLINLPQEKLEEINKMYKRNALAFSDPDPKEREYYQRELLKPQHLINFQLGFGPGQLTTKELANFTTAMSKQRVGDKLIQLMHLLDNPNKQNQSKIKQLKNSLDKTYLLYKKNLYHTFKEFEKTYTNKNKMLQVQENIFYANVDNLKPYLQGSIELQSISGVNGSNAVDSGNMPEKKCIIYTGCLIKEDGELLYKISGRATSGTFSEYIQINEFMQRWGGGGHPGAAASKIPANKLEDFLHDLSMFDNFKRQ